MIDNISFRVKVSASSQSALVQIFAEDGTSEVQVARQFVARDTIAVINFDDISMDNVKKALRRGEE